MSPNLAPRRIRLRRYRSLSKADAGDRASLSDIKPERAGGALAGKHKLNPMLETTRDQLWVFKLLDAAVGVLFEVGFSEVKIV